MAPEPMVSGKPGLVGVTALILNHFCASNVDLLLLESSEGKWASRAAASRMCSPCGCSAY